MYLNNFLFKKYGKDYTSIRDKGLIIENVGTDQYKNYIVCSNGNY